MNHLLKSISYNTLEVVFLDTFKVGDIVARRSYNYDVLFRITNINNGIADLVGISVRIVADALVV